MGLWATVPAAHCYDLQAAGSPAQPAAAPSHLHPRCLFLPQYMHWTDAFTSRLTARTKLVGSLLTCEGAPKGGDAGGEGVGVQWSIIAIPGFLCFLVCRVPSPYTPTASPLPQRGSGAATLSCCPMH